MKRLKFEVSSSTRKGVYVTYDIYDALEYFQWATDGRRGLRVISDLYNQIKESNVDTELTMGYGGDYGTFDGIKW